ncbi:MAG: beta-propeller fold lactonase family protein [Betaproteobacteria bacterium]|nr:beta-propeller fold lactonase family protein [Betaproteobacteria bacterium]
MTLASVSRRVFALQAALAAAGAGAQTGSTGASPATLPLAIVLNSRDASVSLIDQKSFQEVGRVDVGKEPHHLYPKPDGRSLIVANAISNDLHFLDPATGQVQRRLRQIDDPYQIGFSPDNRWFVAVCLRLDRVDLYHYDGVDIRLARRVPAPKAPSHVWFSADSRMAFVTLQDSDEIAAIDLQTQDVAWKLRLGRQPAGILVTPDDRLLMVGVMGQDHVDVIDWRARRSVARLRTGRGAHNFRGAGDRRHVYVSNRVDNSISRIDMNSLQVVQTIPVPGGPDCMEILDDRRTMWITARFARQVAIVDLEAGRVTRTVPVGRSPHGVYLHNRAPLI